MEQEAKPWKNTWQPRQHGLPLPQIQYGPWTGATEPRLLDAKNKIVPLEESNRWEVVKKMANPYEMVYTHEDPFFHPSITILKPLSRSYFKMIELLDVLQFFEKMPKQQPKLRTGHVAEGPGGFIQAAIDIAERNKKLLERATGMTLKPTDQRVPGWRRASTFLHGHKEVKLHYGVDGTGDIYQLGNQDSFVEAVAPGVHLFTADGGFDFSINYDTQEQRVYHLLLCSATIGLRSLLPDGAFVLKVFDVFSDATKFLLCMIGRCFKEWMLYKPAMSRPCNSERYFLGRGFRGLPPDTFRLLLELQQKSLMDQYPSASAFAFASAEAEADAKADADAKAEPLLHPTEVAYFKAHTEANTEEQLKSLEKAMEFSREPARWYEEQLNTDFKVCRAWCNKHRIPVEYKEPVSIVTRLLVEAALDTE